MVLLQPEIYRMIIESMLAGDGPPDFDTKLDQQQNLARLMRVSKLLCTICEPFLYKDCLVDDIDLFVTDLEPRSRKEYLLNRVTTLRLHHPIDHSPHEPPYLDLLSHGRWDDNGRKTGKQDHNGILDRAKNDENYAHKVWGRVAVDELDRAITGVELTLDQSSQPVDYGTHVDKVPLEDQAFANLERVVMAGEGVKAWNAPWTDLTMVPVGAQRKTSPFVSNGVLIPNPIPHYLVGSKSVKHYCQSSRQGPLALKHSLIRPIKSPEIVTYHLPREVGPKDMHLPPVVIGSVNRYIFQSPHVIISDTNGDDLPYSMVGPIIEGLEESLTDATEVLLLHPNNFEFVSLADVALDTTTVEVYGYCQHVDIDEHIARGQASDFGPSNLNGIQAELDKYLDERWKGRIILKNREDAPPCSACGKQPYQA